MAWNIKILGANELRQELATAGASVPGELEKNVRRAGEIVTSAAQRNFKGSRTRALYQILNGKRVRRKPPWPVTSPPDMLGVFEGTYRRAISYDVTHVGTRVTAEVGPVKVVYAPVHEFGLGRMPARPVLTPAVESNKERVFAMLGMTFQVLK